MCHVCHRLQGLRRRLRLADMSVAPNGLPPYLVAGVPPSRQQHKDARNGWDIEADSYRQRPPVRPVRRHGVAHVLMCTAQQPACK